MTDAELLARAWAARTFAYAPYSGFAVGAAVLTASDQVFVGCNVENATFPLTVCAERVAISNAVSAGQQHVVTIAVVTDTDPAAAPCGACRQVIHEFGASSRVIVGGRAGIVREYSIRDLLPAAFGGEFLRK